MSKQQRWRERNPWIRYLEWARRRCRDKKYKSWKFYGGKGIECRLTLTEVREVWERDRAHKLKKPSLDRIDSKLHYESGNVRFIEFHDNVTGIQHHPFLNFHTKPDGDDEVPF